jgi:hypothetical protein
MSRLTFDEIRALWINNGGHSASADVAAAIALAESGGRTDAYNPTPPDDSVGLWQVNYYGALRATRVARYGTPEWLLAHPDGQARAAIDISSGGTNFRPWSTYTSGAYRGHLPPLPTLTGGTKMASALVALAPAPDGKGYWILASDGAIYAFGSAVYLGGLVADGQGNWQVRKEGQ